MASLIQEVVALEQRRKALTKQLADADARLERVRAILGPDLIPAPAVPAATAAAAAQSRSLHQTNGNGVGRRSWFEPGEAITLSKKILRKPMRPAQLVRALAEAKGFSQKLAKEDLNRFQVAAYAAIKHAIGAKKLNKAKDGTIRK